MFAPPRNPNRKPWTVEIAGNGDIELLDFGLRRRLGSDVRRQRRLLNIRSLEHHICSLRWGKRSRQFQPFRAEYLRNVAGNYLIDCGSAEMSDVAIKMAEKLGFDVVSVTTGSLARVGLTPGLSWHYEVELNGRAAAFDLST